MAKRINNFNMQPPPLPAQNFADIQPLTNEARLIANGYPMGADRIRARGPDLEVLQSQLEDAQTQLSNSVDMRHLNNVIAAMTDKFNTAVDSIMNDGERQYIQGMVDPFHSAVPGVRVPSLNPTATYTQVDFTTTTLQTNDFAATGKIVVICNLTAIRPEPVLVMRDQAGLFAPLSAAAPLVKNVNQYDAFTNHTAQRTLGIWGTKTPANTTLLNYCDAPCTPMFKNFD